MLNFFSSPIVKPPLSGRISIGRKSLGDYSAAKSQSPVYSATRLPIKKSSPETPSDVENPKVKTPTADSVETPFKKLKSPIEKIATPHLINRGQICLPYLTLPYLTLSVHTCDDCNYGSFLGRCIICGGKVFLQNLVTDDDDRE